MSEAAIADVVTEAVESPVVDTPQEPVAAAAIPEDSTVNTTDIPEVHVEAEAETYDFESLPEYQAAVKPDAPESKAEAELPGTPLDEIEYRAEQRRAASYSQVMQATDANWRDFLQNELSLSPQEAQTGWEKLRPILQGLHQNNASHNAALFDHNVGRVLPPELAQEYMSRGYRNQAEAMAALVALGKKMGSQEWEAKLDKGDYVHKSKIKTILEAADAQRNAKRQQADGISQSGQALNGVALNGNVNPATMSPDQYEAWKATATPAQIKQAWYGG